jgi:hypothetical protein
MLGAGCGAVCCAALCRRVVRCTGGPEQPSLAAHRYLLLLQPRRTRLAAPHTRKALPRPRLDRQTAAASVAGPSSQLARGSTPATMLGKDPAAQARVIREVIRSYTYVLIWMCVSIAVIMFNKWLLAFSGFPFPIALTLWHMFFCSSVGILAVRVLKLVKSHNMTPREYYTRVMPIGEPSSMQTAQQTCYKSSTWSVQACQL